MEPYLLLLIFIPTTAAFVDCRTACRTCREHNEPAEMLEVYCSMCEECKERRREKMMEKMKHALKEGPPAVQKPEVPHTSEPTTSKYVEMQFPDSPQYKAYHPEPPQETNLPQIQILDDAVLDPSPEVDGCPVQPPCSDEEEVTTPGIKRLSYTSTTTTTTTTTTTNRPCPTIRPCRKPTTTPQITQTPPPPPPPPQSLPPPLPLPPPVPMIPPSYPVNNCFIPNVQPTCTGYSYMRQAGPVLMAPDMLPAPMPPGYMYQPYIRKQKGHYGNQRGHNQESNERQESGLNTERVPYEFISGERTVSTAGLTGIPRIQQLKAANKDYFYVYVGVPKNIKS